MACRRNFLGLAAVALLAGALPAHAQSTYPTRPVSLIVPFPAGPVIVILKILEALKLSPLYPWIYETASKDSFVSIEKAQKVLGYQPQYSNQAALLRNYQWYLAHKDRLSTGDGGITHRVPWKQRALTVVKVFF